MHQETLDLIAFKTEKYGFWNCSRVVKIKYLFLKDKSDVFVVWRVPKTGKNDSIGTI